MEQTVYSQDEILAEHDFAEKLSHDGRPIHGGLDSGSRYLPPRSLNRIDAIRTWSAARPTTTPLEPTKRLSSRSHEVASRTSGL